MIYLLVDYKDDIKNYEFLNKYNNVIIIKNEYNNLNWDHNNNNKTLDVAKEINTEWLMFLNIDQFFFDKELNIKKTIDNVLKIDNDIIQFQFPMYMVSNHLNLPFSFENLSKYNSYRWKYLNACCKTKYIKSVDSHYFGIDTKYKILKGTNIQLFNPDANRSTLILTPDADYYLNNPFSLHFYSRNYYDIIMKVNDHPNKDIIKLAYNRINTYTISDNILINDMIINTLKNKYPDLYFFNHNNNKIEDFLINKKIIDKEKLNEYIDTIKKNVNERLSIVLPNDFNWKQYIQINPDLLIENFNYQDAINHYYNHGFRENRPYNKIDLPINFDWKIYLYNNPDLILANIITEDKVKNHYCMIGYKENRIYQ